MGTLRRPRGSHASLEGRSQPPSILPTAMGTSSFLPWEDRTGLQLLLEEEHRCHLVGWWGLGLGSNLNASRLFAVLPWAADLTSLSLSFFSSVK